MTERPNCKRKLWRGDIPLMQFTEREFPFVEQELAELLEPTGNYQYALAYYFNPRNFPEQSDDKNSAYAKLVLWCVQEYKAYHYCKDADHLPLQETCEYVGMLLDVPAAWIRRYLTILSLQNYDPCLMVSTDWMTYTSAVLVPTRKTYPWEQLKACP